MPKSKISPFDTDLISNAAAKLVHHAGALELEPETQAAALAVAAMIVRERLSGSVTAMMLASMLTRK